MASQNCFRIVIPTLIMALMLTMWPLPDWLEYARPEWVVLVMIYWALAMPEQVGVTVAWVVGLFLDVSHGAIIGQHALGLVVVTYVISTQYQRIRVFSLAQQALVVLLLLLVKRLLVLWVDGMVGTAPDIGWYFLPALTGAIVWPWLFIVLRDLRRRFTVSRNF